MAHEIDMSTGRAAAYYAETPAWHGLGRVTEEAQTSSEALALAGLDYYVEKKPIFHPRPSPLDGRTMFEEIPGYVATVRRDTGAALGVVSPLYRVIQNVEQFDILDTILGDEGIVYESAGALRGGSHVWLLARIPQSIEIADGDTQIPYMLLHTSHDGSTAMTIAPTAVRVVCQNTLNIAMGRARGDNSIKVSHRGDIAKKVADAREALGISLSAFAEYTMIARRLAEKKIGRTDAASYFARLVTGNTEEALEDASTQMRNLHKGLMDSYETDPRQTMPGIRGTAWAALNAFTQHIDHDARTRGASEQERRENRLYSSWFNGGRTAKIAAYEVAREMFIAN